MSVGFAPANALLHQAGARMRFDERIQQFVPDAIAGRRVRGRARQRRLRPRRPAAAMASAQPLRRSSIWACAGRRRAMPAQRRYRAARPSLSRSSSIRDGKNFVDFDEDLQLKDFVDAVQEGFDNIELLKRYTTVGMGPSQGKHSNMNAVRILARIRGQPIGEARHHHRATVLPSGAAEPSGRPRLHARCAARRCTRGTSAPTRCSCRPACGCAPSTTRATGKSKAELVAEEVLAVRSAVGLIDVGTLGKMEVSGPDAGELLERVYTGRFQNLKVGMTRYARDARRVRRHHRRRRRCAARRGALLLHDHDHRLGARLSRAAAAHRACGVWTAASSI